MPFKHDRPRIERSRLLLEQVDPSPEPAQFRDVERRGADIARGIGRQQMQPLCAALLSDEATPASV
jgi:hypothetical protein